tara:strand:- start:9806 stop:10198 length:393 start_codon:yes stop_codon:yes gene_type:complete
MALIKEIFIWWNKQTLSTRLFTLVNGSKVGVDEFGNTYYESKSKRQQSKTRRWVIYNGYADSSKVPANWHSWLHYVTNDLPFSNNKKRGWQKKHNPNLTGTKYAHKPSGSLLNNSNVVNEEKKYESWDPN